MATYRRRGRGDSGDTQPVAVQREIEDLAAVVAEVGGPALVFGASTGGRAPDAKPEQEAMVLGHAAAHCLARAIARGVFAARPAPGNLLPCWCETGASGG